MYVHSGESFVTALKWAMGENETARSITPCGGFVICNTNIVRADTSRNNAHWNATYLPLLSASLQIGS
jgi:hypothetical protein